MLTGIRVIKLTSGDTIVAKLSKFSDKSQYVQVDDPVQFTMMYKGEGEGSLVAQQWLETDETSFSIHKMQIVAEAEPNDMLKDYYFSSLEEIYEEVEDSILTEFESKTCH